MPRTALCTLETLLNGHWKDIIINKNHIKEKRWFSCTHLNTCWQEHFSSSQQEVLVLLAILLGQFAKFCTKGPTRGNEWGETIRLLSPFPPRQAYSPWSILPAISFRCLLHSYPAIPLGHNEFDSEERLPYYTSCCYTPHNFAFVFFPFTSVFKKPSSLHFWSVRQEQCIRNFSLQLYTDGAAEPWVLGVSPHTWERRSSKAGVG